MKLKSKSILAGILTLGMVIIPLTAQACGDKDKNTSESNVPEGTEINFTTPDNSISS